MEWSFVFFLNSALLGVGLAMDAFSVSLANGLHDPYMSRRRGAIIAGTFGVFQAVMPMAGWLCVHTIVELFSAFEKFVPWIALALLGYIGGKMLLEGIKGEEAEETAELSAGVQTVDDADVSVRLPPLLPEPLRHALFAGAPGGLVQHYKGIVFIDDKTHSLPSSSRATSLVRVMTRPSKITSLESVFS